MDDSRRAGNAPSTPRPVRRGLVVGCGYTGAVVAARWQQDGVEVFATTRSAARAAAFAARGWTPVAWDVLRGGDPLPATDAIVYAVGHDRTQGASMADIYVGGLRRTIHALPAGGMLVYVSSTGVYGDAGGAWVDEATPPAPVDDSGAVCLAAEETLRAVANAAGRDWAIVRAAGIYGPGRMIGVEALKAGVPMPGDPQGFLNLIHVEDLAAALDAVARRGEPGEIYLAADGQPPAREDFYAEAARLLGVPAPRFDGAATRRHRGNRRVASAKLRRLEVEFAYPNFRAGLAALLAG